MDIINEPSMYEREKARMIANFDAIDKQIADINNSLREKKRKQEQLAKWHNERIQGIINQERERREKNKVFDPVERRAVESFPEGAQKIFRDIKNAGKGGT